jgi:hypothetical protein
VVTVNDTRAMLARRPRAAGVAAFGHVDVSADGRQQLHDVVNHLASAVASKKEVPFHPDDLPADDEILVAPLQGFDSWFQDQAPWSLERAADEIRATGNPQVLDASGIADGGWSFYLIRTVFRGGEVLAVRAKSPSWGLTDQSKLITRFTGGELKLVREPLIAFDRSADALIMDGKVYVINPRQLENLLIDADAVKARAPQTALAFDQKLRAPLTRPTATAVERVCSHNANVARRVERLVRDTDLSRVTAPKLRAALPDAGLPPSHFGTSGPIKAVSDADAIVLIDLAADLYYQPRFVDSPRRVAAYRRVIRP